ncbi:phage tail protein [Chryseobacterium sp. JUb7]|uniref:phage tail protein n=1 Tax=Chryseobacterium sp. JUb7 TaxID=2940599 RepID=UPI002168FB8A|nr:tail fiber protein [Chryseobacterium sp. JUb7]MCS3530844.1 microcystin-dependent protein [Chryseobacterium sp. JUb7]
MEEILATIKLFAGNFPPRGFMYCNGQILSIAQNTALFSILGTTYGGNGQTTFALPNLNGRYPIGAGSSNTGNIYELGEMAGTPENTLIQTNLPSFASQLKVSKSNANSTSPSSTSSLAVTGTPNGREFDSIPSYVDSDPDTIINMKSAMFIGQNLPVNNMPPYLGLNYIICVSGIFPARP